MKNLILLTLSLMLFVVTSCGDDFEEITNEVIANESIEGVKLSGKVLSNAIISVSEELATLSEEVLPGTSIRVYQSARILEEETTDDRGEYEVEFRIDPSVDEPIFLEIYKEGFVPVIVPIEQFDREGVDWYLFVGDQERITPNSDMSLVSGSLIYDRLYYIQASWRDSDGSTRSTIGGFIESFQLAVPSGVPVEIHIFNELNCDATIPVSVFPEIFTENIDLGDITGLIDLDRVRNVEVEIPTIPGCLEDPQLIVNGTAINLETSPMIFACESTTSLDYLLIDYENSMSSNIVDGTQENLVFECQPYEFEFEIITEFGTFTQDDESVDVRSLYYSEFSLAVDPFSFEEVLFVDIGLNDIWSCSFLVGLKDLENIQEEELEGPPIYCLSFFNEEIDLFLHREDDTNVTSIEIIAEPGTPMTEGVNVVGDLIEVDYDVVQITNEVDTQEFSLNLRVPIL